METMSVLNEQKAGARNVLHFLQTELHVLAYASLLKVFLYCNLQSTNCKCSTKYINAPSKGIYIADCSNDEDRVAYGTFQMKTRVWLSTRFRTRSSPLHFVQVDQLN